MLSILVKTEDGRLHNVVVVLFFTEAIEFVIRSQNKVLGKAGRASKSLASRLHLQIPIEISVKVVIVPTILAA